MKINKFGSATPIQSEKFEEFDGNPLDATPEWESIGKYDRSQAVVRSSGLLLYEMLAKKSLFGNRNYILNAEIQIEGLVIGENLNIC